MSDTKNPPGDFDNPWKEAISVAFEQFMAFFFPRAHAGIDWSRGYERLDKELRQAIPNAEAGLRLVDFLAKVWPVGGVAEEWVFVHGEVQAKAAADVPQRVFIYNTRFYGIGLRPVASFVILADESPNWRPASFGYDLWGCRVSFEFPVAKLTDFRREDLEKSDNLFATVVLAHLETQATRNAPRQRQASKFALIRRLYDRGVPADTVRLLFKVIDWMMTLDKVLEAEFWAELSKFEQERQMPYVTSVERIGIEKGLSQGLSQGLTIAIERVLRKRFGNEGISLMARVRQIQDAAELEAMHDAAMTVASPEEFSLMLNTKDAG